MLPPIKISTVSLEPCVSDGHIFDLSDRCAFAICTKGAIVIKILTEHYHVSARCMWACLPFINIQVVRVIEPCEIIFGSVLLKDVPRMINRWVNIHNLSSIQSHPLVELPDTQFCKLISSVNEYINSNDVFSQADYTDSSTQIQQDIVHLQGSLIVARVLDAFLTNISLEPHGLSPRDLEFQQFMLSLYANFREHRDVKFYAMRSSVSGKYFSTLVRTLSGASPSEWIETVVAGEAKTLLRDSQRSIKEIASALNFPDAPSFTKYFQRVTGMTPKAYRKLI